MFKVTNRIDKLIKAGHTLHCAKRQVWGDGECECPGDGTGTPYHTMNPPPGGWKTPAVKVPFGPWVALRKLMRAKRITTADAAEALGLTVPQMSALRSETMWEVE